MGSFAIIGVGGFVAPRHLQAIRDTGHALVAAVDRSDSVGILDRFFPEARFFVEIERFDRFLERQRRRAEFERVQYVSVCSPNYLHDAHVRLALRVGATAICEKPLVISPWNLDQLSELESEHGARVFTVLQLRCHPLLLALKSEVEQRARRAEVVLTYVTRRGPWYQVSWKGSEEKSGGLAMNLGIHFFDLLIWLFGNVERSEVDLARPEKMAGRLELQRASVRWFLSVDSHDLPEEVRLTGKAAHRSLTIDGREVDFTEGFGELHTRVYERTLAGNGFSIEDARPSIELVHRIRQSAVGAASPDAHPLAAP